MTASPRLSDVERANPKRYVRAQTSFRFRTDGNGPTLLRAVHNACVPDNKIQITALLDELPRMAGDRLAQKAESQPAPTGDATADREDSCWVQEFKEAGEPDLLNPDPDLDYVMSATRRLAC
jgi:hypothetical protein